MDKGAAQKILRTVPFEQGFHFSIGIGKYTPETAVNLFSFYEELKTIELQSVRFHFQRRDFQKWIETSLEDYELASRIDKTPAGLNDEELRSQLLTVVRERLTELQTASNVPEKQTPKDAAKQTLSEEPKKFTLEELKNYDGQDSKPAYILFEGKVYDVTDSGFWLTGDHLGAHRAGRDLTQDILSAPHGPEVLSKMKQIGIVA